MQVQTKGEFGGLGIEVAMENGLVKVVSPIDDTPAFRAGLQPGDFVTHIDGEGVMGLTLNEAVDKMRGPVGSSIKLTIRRGLTSDPFDVSLTRAVIKVQSVRSRVEGDVGYLRITSFNEQTQSGLEKAINAIQKEHGGKLKGYVLDLRNNPGGLLSSAVNVASAFLDRGDIVLYETFGDGTEETFEANGSSLNFDKPFVILVNGSSASGSELVVGAWQDNGIGTVIGETTFGKGTVQTQSSLTNGGSVRLTIARWLRPNREWIHGVGITPNIVVEWPIEAREADPETDPQLDAAIALIAEQVTNP